MTDVLIFDQKMTLRQCEEFAKSKGSEVYFDITCRDGIVKCKWLDPWYGFFTVEGAEGFLMSRDMKIDDVICENVKVGK